MKLHQQGDGLFIYIFSHATLQLSAFVDIASQRVTGMLASHSKKKKKKILPWLCDIDVKANKNEK